MSVRTIKTFDRNDTKRNLIKKNTSKEKKESACSLRASLGQWHLNCTAQAFLLHLHLGLVVGAEVPAALPLTKPV